MYVILSTSLYINTCYRVHFTVYQRKLSCSINCKSTNVILSISLYINTLSCPFHCVSARYLVHFTVYQCKLSCPFHCVSTYIILSHSMIINVCCPFHCVSTHDILTNSLYINAFYLVKFTVYEYILSYPFHCMWTHVIFSISLYIDACILAHFTVYQRMLSCPFHCALTYVTLSNSGTSLLFMLAVHGTQHFSVKLNSRDLNGFCLCTHFPTLMAMFKGCLQQSLKNISISVHVSSSHSSECLLSISGILFPAWTGWYQVALV